ncbi:TPA: hypothetical protein ACH354_002323 [Clostridium perfringens]
MKKLKVTNDYELTILYRFGMNDTFDFWYWRNHNLFLKNDFYENIDINNDEEKFPKIELKLKECGIMKHNKIIIPKGEYYLIEYEENFGNEIFKCWEIKVNGVILTGLCNLLDKNRFLYNKEIADIMYIIN